MVSQQYVHLLMAMTVPLLNTRTHNSYAQSESVAKGVTIV
jgi:hypothetical protein